MYLKNIVIENIGPIPKLDINLPFTSDGNPKPVVMIGSNGSGKSIFLSQIINSLILAKQQFYEDLEVEKDKVFKYRSPSYIKSGSKYYFSKVVFENDLYQSELQLITNRKDYEENIKTPLSHPEFNKINAEETNILDSNFNSKPQELKNLIDMNCIIYFPPNRFEEPGWLNDDNLLNKAQYRFSRNISSKSERRIINYSPLRDNQNWLLDVIFDRQALEIQTTPFPLNVNNGITIPLQAFQGYVGECSNIYQAILDFLKLLFQTNESIRFGVGKRKNRNISIMLNEESWIQNLFNLSTGETSLLNIFLTIIKDYDLTRTMFSSLSEIRGIVIVDEIDLHLHTQHQYEILPKLLKAFPKVQFILTSHSPLFLLGLEKEFGQNNYCIYNLPDGSESKVEEFIEFENAYLCFKNTTKYQADLINVLRSNSKIVLFVEGDYDIRYLEKSASLLGKTDLLNDFKLIDGDGYGNLDKVWKSFNSKIAEILKEKTILLYDCDTNKSEISISNLHKKIIPSIDSNPIKKGIENLFTRETILKAKLYKSDFIDIYGESEKIIRGQTQRVPERWEVNKDEKGNMCNWLCENGTIDDFANFILIFDLLETLKNS